MRSVDLLVGMSMAMLLSSVGLICGNVGILGYTTKGTFLLILVPLGILYSHFQSYYQKSNLELKRLDSIANSPIVSQFTETLNGVTSVRAFGSHEKAALDMENHVVQVQDHFLI